MKPEEALKRLQEAGEDQEKLTLVSIEIAISGVSEPRQEVIRDFVYAAAIPHWFDAKILSELLNNASSQEASEAYSALKTFAFVEEFLARGGANIHEKTRLTLLRWMIREQPDRYAALSSKAATLFGEGQEPYEVIESLYHSLIVDPDAASHSLTKIFDDWRTHGRVESCQALAVMLEEHLGEKRLTGRALATALDVAATIEWTYRPLHQTEERLQECLQIYHEIKDEHSESVVLDEIGDIRRAQGENEEALHAFVAALALRLKLTVGRPWSAAADYAIALHHSKIGRIRRDQKGFDDARRSFEAGLAITEHLVKLEPENLLWKRGLALCQTNIGDIQRSQERLEEAVQSFHSALAIIEELRKVEPDNAEWIRDVALVHTRIGDIALDQKKPAEALRSYEAALAFAQALVKQDDKNTQWQRDLSVALGKVGYAYRNAGTLLQSKRFFELSLEVALKLVAYDPANAVWRKDRDICQKDLDETVLALKNTSTDSGG